MDAHTKCKRCRDCSKTCFCNCSECWSQRVGMRKLKLNASLTAPLDPSDEGRATGGSDSSSRRTHALEGLATLAQCQPSVAEWLRLCLAVRCLCLLQMGRQGPAEGSVLSVALTVVVASRL